MRAGTCVGVAVGQACVGVGWSPHWLPPTAFADTVDALVALTGGTVCPYCVVERALSARIAGFNRPKADRIRAALDGFHCMRPGGTRSETHTHLFDFPNEILHECRGHDQTPPGLLERGYGVT